MSLYVLFALKTGQFPSPGMKQKSWGTVYQHSGLDYVNSVCFQKVMKRRQYKELDGEKLKKSYNTISSTSLWPFLT